jgi:phosphate transport system substrate-binding protein
MHRPGRSRRQPVTEGVPARIAKSFQILEEIVSMKPFALAALSAAMLAGTAHAASRDYISIVGSSTVYPFATVVAEQFGKTSSFKTPKIESTGSGGGLKLFCAGVGVEHPDITNASRRIKKSEVETCAANGVADVVEVKVGYDGIVLANAKSAKPLSLTRKDIFLALAKSVPNPDKEGELVANPYKMWNEVNPGRLRRTRHGRWLQAVRLDQGDEEAGQEEVQGPLPRRA